MDKLINFGEIKSSFIDRQESHLSRLLLTAQVGADSRVICFKPQSHAYQTNKFTVFDQYGVIDEDCGDECYYCLFNSTDYDLGEEIWVPENTPEPDEPTVTVSPTPVVQETVDDICSDFDPMYPNYAFTFNYDDTWYDEYGCTNFAVGDYGCDDYCPEGYRHMVKHYYANGDAFATCLHVVYETADHYCVEPKYARCELTNGYRSDPDDFVYGCSNPRRPIYWVKDGPP